MCIKWNAIVKMDFINAKRASSWTVRNAERASPVQNDAVTVLNTAGAKLLNSRLTVCKQHFEQHKLYAHRQVCKRPLKKSHINHTHTEKIDDGLWNIRMVFSMNNELCTTITVARWMRDSPCTRTNRYTYQPMYARTHFFISFTVGSKRG